MEGELGGWATWVWDAGLCENWYEEDNQAKGGLGGTDCTDCMKDPLDYRQCEDKVKLISMWGKCGDYDSDAYQEPAPGWGPWVPGLGTPGSQDISYQRDLTDSSDRTQSSGVPYIQVGDRKVEYERCYRFGEPCPIDNVECEKDGMRVNKEFCEIQRWKQIISELRSIENVQILGLVETKQRYTGNTRYFGMTMPRGRDEMLRDIEDYLELGGFDGFYFNEAHDAQLGYSLRPDYFARFKRFAGDQQSGFGTRDRTYGGALGVFQDIYGASELGTLDAVSMESDVYEQPARRKSNTRLTSRKDTMLFGGHAQIIGSFGMETILEISQVLKSSNCSDGTPCFTVLGHGGPSSIRKSFPPRRKFRQTLPTCWRRATAAGAPWRERAKARARLVPAGAKGWRAWAGKVCPGSPLTTPMLLSRRLSR
jgi:hypothetical protein